MNYPTKKSSCIIIIFIIFCATVASGNEEECKRKVKLIFKEGISPRDFFLYAFQNLSETYFSILYPKNELAFGYYKELFNNIKHFNWDNVPSPYKHCEEFNNIELTLCQSIVLKVFGREGYNFDTEKKRVKTMQGKDAFRHVYFTQIFDNLKVNIVFAQPEGIFLFKHDNVEEWILRKQKENQLNQQKIDMMQGYFNILNGVASSIGMNT